MAVEKYNVVRFTMFLLWLQSGLTEASRKSNVSLKDAEKQVLDFVKSHTPEKKCPLGGNSVYMDRLFIRKYMPILDNYLHYRVIDVSTIKELAKRWYQKEFSNMPQKKFRHRSVDDILESIEELKYFKQHIFKSTMKLQTEVWSIEGRNILRVFLIITVHWIMSSIVNVMFNSKLMAV